ncbi:hypothetical protein ES708_19134 [subsurface metagenome]
MRFFQVFILPSFLTNVPTAIKSASNNIAIPPEARRCFILILPINISKSEIPKIKAAVDRFAGRINTQIITTGIMTGKNASLKLFISPCFIDNTLAIYIIRASLAKSDVWIVNPSPGKVSQRVAWLKFVPRNRVSIKRITAIPINN